MAPREWSVPALGTLCDVDTGDLSHPLSRAWSTTLGGIGGLAQQLTALAQSLGLAPIRQEAIVPEAHDTLGQHVQENTSDALGGIAGHGLHTIVLATVAVGEANLAVTDIKDTVVRDRDAMRVATDRVQDVFQPRQGLLDVDDPRLAVEMVVELREALGRGPVCDRIGERQSASGVRLVQRVNEFPAEDLTQRLHREEEAGMGGEPTRAVTRQCPSRHETVHMAMWAQRLVPGGEDHGASDLPAQGGVAELHQCLAGGGAQEGHQGPFVGQHECIERVWQGKDGVQRGHGQAFRLAVFQPLRLGQGLARGAVAMATGVVGLPLAPTVGAVFGVPTALGSTADRHSVHDLLMGRRHGMRRTVDIARQTENVRHCPPRCALPPRPSSRVAAG